MQLYKLTFSLLALASLGSADTIQLKAGTTLSGTYMGGTGRELRFAVGDQVKTYRVDEVQSITFGDDTSSAAASSLQHNRPVPPTPMVAADTKVYVRLIDSIDSKKEGSRRTNLPRFARSTALCRERHIVCHARDGLPGRFSRTAASGAFHGANAIIGSPAVHDDCESNR